ncbi:MAG: tetratricopeptide repeat protein [Crocinitomicaceae bacterium]|nr:tetratricopeptide repeat protein [Crocinitomicaceae bacterium]
MKIKLNSLLMIFLLLGISACGESEDIENEENSGEETVDYDQFMQELVDIENKINANVANPDKELLKEAITKYQDLAGFFPEDPKAPEYLFKASDLALSTGQPEKSVKILTRIMDEYPEYEKMEDVMFNKASHLDFELRDTTAAKELYADFIEKYPESELVDDAESRIENISLSLDELVEKFMANIEETPEVP